MIDAAGVSASLELVLWITRAAVWITKVGWGRDRLGFSLDPLVQKGIRLQGSFSYNWPVWERVVDLLATGRLDLDPLIGGTSPLEAWAEAFRAMHGRHIAKAVLLLSTLSTSSSHPTGSNLRGLPLGAR